MVPKKRRRRKKEQVSMLEQIQIEEPEAVLVKHRGVIHRAKAAFWREYKLDQMVPCLKLKLSCLGFPEPY